MVENEEVNEVRHNEEIGGTLAVTSSVELRATVVFKQCPQPKKLNGRPHLPPKCGECKRPRIISPAA